MKFTVSLILIFCIVLSCTVFAFGFDAERNAFSFADGIGKFYTGFVCTFYKAFHFLFPSDTPQTRDGFSLSHIPFDGTDFVNDPEIILNTETWRVVEQTFTSEKNYGDPFNDVDLNLILAGNGYKYVIPCFWDGGNIWKARFVCPSAGEWYFRTECTDGENASLNGRTGKVVCNEYSGNLDVYKHGFVTARECKKYFTYDDGTPFFYLGDTHWSLGDETVDMVKTISRKRAEQGFTVWQSEPIGASFDFTNGITDTDIPGLHVYDEKFEIIAESGLVHANAEFFFPSYMQVLLDRYGGIVDGEINENAREYLERISRYWVARYSAYPVMWTLGQEADNDFYANRDEYLKWTPENNPYLLVAEYIDKYDPYDHPLSAHQENSGETACYGSGKGLSEKRKSYCDAEPSVFRNTSAHSWYAVQWTPSKTSQSKFRVEKDYWYNSQGKPAINYEGQYCYLWTKNYGARMQGWLAYTNGMYGYGWGGHDTWSYLNTYNEDADSSDGVDTVTSAEKINATWQDSLEYPSSYQVGYMKQFFEKTEWWNLQPRFNDKSYFAPCTNVYYSVCGNDDNSEIVAYFYSFSDETVGAKPNAKGNGGVMTGTLGNLIPNGTYIGCWFNPVTGEYSEQFDFTASALGTYYIGRRNMNGEAVDCDMVFYASLKD